jgi:hypothetical protein
MHKSMSLMLLLALTLSAHAEEQPSGPWTQRLVGGVTLTQVALKDWVGGGEDALAWSLSLEGRSAYVKPQQRIDWKTSYKFAFGQTKLGGGGIRKTDDRIDLESIFVYTMGVYVNPYIGATFKTQFAKGYKYPETGKLSISQFLDPAYLTQSVGAGYEPVPEVKTRLGLALRQIITRDFTDFADGKQVKVDGGMESVTQAEWEARDNLLLNSRVEVFAPFAELDMTVIRNDNAAVVRVSKYISVNLNVQVVRDKSATADTQIKQALAMGLNYTFR